jgi:antitoxin component YwqK of YwqJK toxin-antitoxin module
MLRRRPSCEVASGPRPLWLTARGLRSFPRRQLALSARSTILPPVNAPRRSSREWCSTPTHLIMLLVASGLACASPPREIKAPEPRPPASAPPPASSTEPPPNGPDTLSCSNGSPPKIVSEVLHEDEAIVVSSCVDTHGVRDGEHRQQTYGGLRNSLLLGHFKDGRRVGTWTLWLSDPSCHEHTRCPPHLMSAENTFDDDGLLDGETRVWSDTGQLLLDEHFAKGARRGSYREYYPSGRPRVQGTFADGKTTKLPELHLADVSDYLVKDWLPASSPFRGTSVPVGTWRFWLEDGTLQSVRSFDPEGNPEGPFCRRDECVDVTNGTGTVDLENDGEDGWRVWEHFTLRDRLLDGTVETKRIDGPKPHLLARSVYRMGQLDGLDEAWDPDGKLLRRQTYREGILDGPSFERTTASQPGEELTTEGRYCHGLKCGVFRERSSSGEHSEDVYRTQPDSYEELISSRRWDKNGVLVERWSEAESRRFLHAQCLAALRRGDCCELGSDPPPNAAVCHKSEALFRH